MTLISFENTYGNILLFIIFLEAKDIYLYINHPIAHMHEPPSINAVDVLVYGIYVAL